MYFRASHVFCLVLASVWLLEPANSLFPNTLNGFLQDVQQNPASLLALLVLKYWLLITSGAITVTGTAVGKRDASGPMGPSDEFYSALLSKVDGDHCIPRLICGSLAEGGKDGSSPFRQKILTTFGGKASADSLPSPKSPVFVYKYAAYVGKLAPTVDACKRMFPKCKQSVSELEKMASLVFESNV